MNTLSRYGIQATLSNSAGQVLSETRYQNVLLSETEPTMDSSDRELSVQAFQYDALGEVVEVGQWRNSSARLAGNEQALFWQSRSREYLGATTGSATAQTTAIERAIAALNIKAIEFEGSDSLDNPASVE